MTAAPRQGGKTGDWWPPLIDTWFGTLTRADWFAKSDAVDAALKEKFGGLPDVVDSLGLDASAAPPEQVLAAVLALDQLPRNLYRGTAKAFAFDGEARRIALDAVSVGKDRGLTLDQRAFLYLPFEHSEDLADQDLSVDLISALGDAEYTRFAVAHRRIIARFGRFPHRNAILERASTAEEVAFLREPGSAF